MKSRTDPQAKIDSAGAAEQKFLCLLWLDPIRGQEVRCGMQRPLPKELATQGLDEISLIR